jgi:hypothetical protein
LKSPTFEDTPSTLPSSSHPLQNQNQVADEESSDDDSLYVPSNDGAPNDWSLPLREANEETLHEIEQRHRRCPHQVLPKIFLPPTARRDSTRETHGCSLWTPSLGNSGTKQSSSRCSRWDSIGAKKTPASSTKRAPGQTYHLAPRRRTLHVHRQHPHPRTHRVTRGEIRSNTTMETTDLSSASTSRREEWSTNVHRGHPRGLGRQQEDRTNSATKTRPDILFAVSYLASVFTHPPRHEMRQSVPEQHERVRTEGTEPPRVTQGWSSHSAIPPFSQDL